MKPRFGKVRLWLHAAGLVLGILAGFASNGYAQARSSADRVNTISAFATAARVDTDDGAKDFGYVIGADFTRNYRFLSPSLEVRFTGTGGDTIKEYSTAGGLKLDQGFGRLHPYADLLVGYGKIDFVNGPADYNHDNSSIYDAGLGADYRVSRSLSLKLDGQYQFWYLGRLAGHLRPYNVSVGVVFRLPIGRDKLP